MRLSKFAKTGAALALALGMSAALTVTPAAAQPHNSMMGGNMMGGKHMDAMHDHGHRPAMRAERRPPQPRGHYRWRAGNWAWHGDHWDWAPGIWVRF